MFRVSTLIISSLIFLRCFSMEAIASENEIKSTLLEVLRNQQFHNRNSETDKAQIAQLIRWSRAAQAEAALQNDDPARLASIKEAPYLGMVLAEKIPELYSKAYETAYEDQYYQQVSHVSLEILFDAFIQSILDNKLSPSMKAQGNQIGRCLAKKVTRGKSSKCRLDETDRINAPSFLTLGWDKVSCGISFLAPSSCKVRKDIYNTAKSALIAARMDPAILKLVAVEFEKQFNPKFRAEFLSQLGTQVDGFPSLVADKFKGATDPLWTQSQFLQEAELTDSALSLQYGSFAEGLQTEVMAAASLASSSDPDLRGLSAPLSYSAVNRLLMVNGGSTAAMTWPNPVFLDSGSNADLKIAGPLQMQAYGNWGQGNSPTGPSFSPWDWANYAKGTDTGVPGFRIFPSLFSISPVGLPLPGQPKLTENLQDLSSLLSASTQFFKLSIKSENFGAHFGTKEQLLNLLDPSDPILFPHDVRLIPLGIASAVLRNLFDARSGHFDLSLNGNTSLIEFHDQVTIAGKLSTPTPVSRVAAMLLSLSEFKKLLASPASGDPMFPSELKALDPKLGQAIELIALYLGGKGQEGDGGFRDLINHPQAQGRSLETSIQGMDALSEAYTAKPTLLMKIRLREGWKFITKLFGSGTVPHPNETFAQTMVAPHVLWKLVNLWDRSQSLIRGSVGTSVDWATLESRIEVLRRVLADQIQSDHGPEALLEGSHL